MPKRVQDVITDLVEEGYRIVYTDGSSKRLGPNSKERVGGFGVYALNDILGPEVRFCGYGRR